jgi:DNA-binding MurR/RpiR family transcriptional regulator
LRNPETATFASLDELSKRIGVSDATLIRYARELGFEGYRDLRHSLVWFIRGVIYPKQKPVFPTEQKELPTLENVKNEDIEFINRTMNGINQEWFEELIEMIISSKRIFTMGWGISSFLAEFLALQLTRLSLDAYPLVRERRPLIERLLFVRNGDLLIVFDLIEYSTEVLEAVEYLHTHKETVKLVTITNDSMAPIVQYADRVFFCDTLSPLVSLTAPACLINAIVRHVIEKKPKTTKEAVRRFKDDVLGNPRHYVQFERYTTK